MGRSSNIPESSAKTHAVLAICRDPGVGVLIVLDQHTNPLLTFPHAF